MDWELEGLRYGEQARVWMFSWQPTGPKYFRQRGLYVLALQWEVASPVWEQQVSRRSWCRVSEEGIGKMVLWVSAFTGTPAESLDQWVLGDYEACCQFLL